MSNGRDQKYLNVEKGLARFTPPPQASNQTPSHSNGSSTGTSSGAGSSAGTNVNTGK